jgi:octaprenyl-diphosphate synthase
LLRQQWSTLYAEDKMAESARSPTLDIYPPSDFKDALILMVNYVIERKK